MRDEMTWSFYQIWNKSLEEGTTKRKMEPRDRIWASEIGGSHIDRYLKMIGTEPTNPYNPRSLRKFEAGRIWEHIVGYVLKRAGILLDEQEWLKFQYEGLLPVTGKLDFIAGGNPDYDKALHSIQNEFSWLPSFISRATQNIIRTLKAQYPNGLEKVILEIKSCSSYMFEIYEKNQIANTQHKYQNFHYLKAKGMKEGHIVYLSKDDARMLEFGIFNPSYVEEGYKKDIETMTSYLMNDTRPPLEDTIVYDKEFKRFSANWKVGYSLYLTMLYGLENQKEFDDLHKPISERWNRVLGRIKEGKDMTDKNKQILDEIQAAGFNVEEIKNDANAEYNDREAEKVEEGVKI